MAFIYDLTDTWNAGGTTFSAIKMNVTDTASASASKLVQCQISGTDKFTVGKDGGGYFAGNVGIGTSSPGARLETSVASNGATVEVLRLSNAGVGANTQAQINFLAASTSYGTITSGFGAAAPQMVFNLPSVSAGNYIWQISGTERMRITSAGDVGIGAASTAASRLRVYTNTDNAYAARFDQDHPTGWGVLIDTDATVNTDPALWVKNASDTIMWAGSGGNVGIGTSSPQDPLHVAGDIRTDNAAFIVQETSTGGGIRMLGINASNAAYVGPIDAGPTSAIYNASSTSAVAAFYTSGSERMRIDSSGRVGIGTSSPSAKLDVRPAANNIMQVKSASHNTLTAPLSAATTYSRGGDGITDLAAVFGWNNGGLAMAGREGLAFATGGASSYSATTERMRIDSSGNVGIGTASPAYRTDILGVGVASNTVQPLLQLRSASDALNNSVEMLLTPIISGQTRTAIGGVREGATANAAIYMATNNTERMRITSAGSVGIGTSSPLAVSGYNTLSINGTSGGALALYVNGTIAGSIAAFSNDIYYDSVDATIWRNGAAFNGTPTERMRIDSSGNLLVGTTNSANITVSGQRLTPNYAMFAATNSGTSPTVYVGVNGGGAYLISFFSGATTVGHITTNGTNTNYATSSDYRLKDIDGPITNSGAYIDALKPVQGSWKADGSRFIGLLAHEVQEVSETQIATGEKDGEEMQAMDYSAPEIIANLIAEIQSMRLRLAQLEG